jgi:hypothetical protein
MTVLPSMRSDIPFPLTLALSLREREHPLAGREEALNAGQFPGLAIVLPLPKGEGRGEGERCIRKESNGL